MKKLMLIASLLCSTVFAFAAPNAADTRQMTDAFAQALEEQNDPFIRRPGLGRDILPYEQDLLDAHSAVRVQIIAYQKDRPGPQDPTYTSCQGQILTQSGWLLLGKECTQAVAQNERLLEINFDLPISLKLGEKVHYRAFYPKKKDFKADKETGLSLYQAAARIDTSYYDFNGRKIYNSLSVPEIISFSIYLQPLFDTSENLRQEWQSRLNQVSLPHLQTFLGQYLSPKDMLLLHAK